jgi:hypothetical protein
MRGSVAFFTSAGVFDWDDSYAKVAAHHPATAFIVAYGLPVTATRGGEVERVVPEFAGHLFDNAEDIPALGTALIAGLSSGIPIRGRL